MLQMNPEIRAKWASKLRSGEFRQGVEYLAYDDPSDGVRKYCCMGVLCELAAEEGVVTGEVIENTVYYGADGDNRVLPEEVINWAELSDSNPDLRPYKPSDKWYRGQQYQMSCADANDGERLSFSEIADLIDGGVDGDS